MEREGNIRIQCLQDGDSMLHCMTKEGWGCKHRKQGNKVEMWSFLVSLRYIHNNTVTLMDVGETSAAQVE